MAAVGTGLVRRYALARSLLDQPVARSSHRIATPTAGGIAIVSAFYAGLLMLTLLQPELAMQLSPGEMLVLLTASVLAVAGWLDDLHQLDFRLRIVVQFAAALCVVLLLGEMPALQLAGFQVSLGFWAWPLLILILVWASNLYNFMDGIDGLAASECGFIALVAALLLFRADADVLAVICLLLAAGSTGFLFWNWAPAKIFMGDTGSGFLGFLLASIALISIHDGSMQPWSWLLLPAVFIADATTTVLRRMLGGEPWYQAHCSHAYQHLARKYSHRSVNQLVLLVNLLWLLPLTWVTEKHPEYGVYLACFGIVPLFLAAYLLGAGREGALDASQDSRIAG